MSRRGSDTGPQLTVIWWEGIPAQVVARGAEGVQRTELPPRFQRAIDAVAMRDGLAGTDAYLQRWERRSRPCGPDLAREVADEVARLEAAFSSRQLATIVSSNDDGAVAPTTEEET